LRKSRRQRIQKALSSLWNRSGEEGITQNGRPDRENLKNATGCGRHNISRQRKRPLRRWTKPPSKSRRENRDKKTISLSTTHEERSVRGGGGLPGFSPKSSGQTGRKKTAGKKVKFAGRQTGWSGPLRGPGVTGFGVASRKGKRNEEKEYPRRMGKQRRKWEIKGGVHSRGGNPPFCMASAKKKKGWIEVLICG